MSLATRLGDITIGQFIEFDATAIAAVIVVFAIAVLIATWRSGRR